MMINKINLINWRSHKDTTLDFAKGTNVFVGIMGSGKSSVLDALCYGFYGKFPKSNRREIKLSDIIRFGEKKSQVKVWFSVGDDNYLVVREVGSNVAELYIIKGDNLKLIQKDKNRVTKAIISLLGTDYSLFTRAIYSEQNNMDYFLNLDPKKRKEELDRLLGIDKFNTALSNTHTVINKLESRLKDIALRYSKDDMKQLKSNMAQVNGEIQTIKDKVGKLEEEKEKMNVKIKSDMETFKQIEDKKKKFENLKNRLSVVQGKIENLTSQVERIKFDPAMYEKLKSDYEKLKKTISKLKDEHTNHVKTQKEKFGRISEFKEKIKRLESVKNEKQKLEEHIFQLTNGKTIDEINKEIASFEKRIQDMKSDMFNKNEKIKELKKMMAELKPGMAKCPLCGSELNDAHIKKLTTERNDEIKKLNKDIENINVELAKAVDILNDLKKKKVTVEQENAIIKNINKEISSLQVKHEHVAELENEYETVSKKVTQLENEITENENREKELLSQLKDFDYGKKITESLNKEKNEYEKIKQEIGILNYNETEYMEWYEKIKSFNNEIEKIMIELKGLRDVLNEKNNLLKTYNSEYALLNKMEQIAKEYNEKIMELKKFRNAMNDTVVELRNHIINALNVAVEELWPHVYPYKDYDGIQIVATEKDYNFMIHVKNNEWVGMEQTVSGGERMCAALVFRIALAIVLTPELSWLVLDEPTHNLDTEAVDLMSHMLEEKIPSIVNQTFVITHDESLLNHEYNRVYLFKRDKENEGPTQVERIR